MPVTQITPPTAPASAPAANPSLRPKRCISSDIGRADPMLATISRATGKVASDGSGAMFRPIRPVRVMLTSIPAQNSAWQNVSSRASRPSRRSHMIVFLHVDKHFTGSGRQLAAHMPLTHTPRVRPGAEMAAVVVRRHAKPAHEGPPHCLGGAEPEIPGDAVHRVAGPLQPPAGGVEPRGLDELQRSRP